MTDPALAALRLDFSRYRYNISAFAERVVPWGKPGTPYESWRSLWPIQRRFFDQLSRQLRDREWGPNDDGTITRKAPILMCVPAGTGVSKTSVLLTVLATWALLCWPHMKGLIASATKEHAKDKALDAVITLIKHSPELSAWLGYSTTDSSIWIEGERESSKLVTRPADTVGTHGMGGMTISLLDEYQYASTQAHEDNAGPRRDPQAIAIVFGNPRFGFGPFVDMIQGFLADLWTVFRISQYDVPGNDTDEYRAQMIDECGGETSDFYRWSVEGLPPITDSDSFVAEELVLAAMSDKERPLTDGYGRSVVPTTTALVCGIDLSWGGWAGKGKDLCCAAWCAGIDQRTVPPRSVRGIDLKPEERAEWIIAQHNRRTPYGQACVTYVDITGSDGLLMQSIRNEGYGDSIRGVNFGFSDKSEGGGWCVRDALWIGFRRWLEMGGCMRRDDGIRRILTSASARVDRGRIRITQKDALKKAVPIGPFDELDARFLAALAPTPEDIVRRRGPQPERRPPQVYGTLGSGGGRSWMGT